MRSIFGHHRGGERPEETHQMPLLVSSVKEAHVTESEPPPKGFLSVPKLDYDSLGLPMFHDWQIVFSMILGIEPTVYRIAQMAIKQSHYIRTETGGLFSNDSIDPKGIGLDSDVVVILKDVYYKQHKRMQIFRCTVGTDAIFNPKKGLVQLKQDANDLMDRMIAAGYKMSRDKDDHIYFL